MPVCLRAGIHGWTQQVVCPSRLWTDGLPVSPALRGWSARPLPACLASLRVQTAPAPPGQVADLQAAIDGLYSSTLEWVQGSRN